MFDAILVIAGISCNKSKMGGWGFSAYDIKNSTKYKLPESDKYKEKMIGDFYLSNYGVNKAWKLAEKGDESFTVLEIDHLIESAGSTFEPSSLAKAESHGFLEAIKLVDDKGWKKVLICCDSRYVAQNLEKIVKNKNDLVLKRKDGNKISTYDYWEEITNLILKLDNVDVRIKWSWVKDFLPKDMEEYSKLLAKKGQALTFNKKERIDEIYPFGRKKVPENKAHGFLTQARMYFIPNILNNTADGKKYYFCGNHGKMESWCGKPKSDSTISVFIMNELDPVLELIMKVKREYSPNDKGQIIRLDNVKTAGVRNEIISYHKNLMLFNSESGNLYDYTGRLFVLEQNPPFLFFKLYEKLEDLYIKLNSFIIGAEDENVFYLDITDKIYKINKRGSKELTDAFKSNKCIDINLDKLNTKVTLTVGIELLSDLGLKRIAAENPEVRLYVEKVGPILYKYYVFIKTNKGTGLFTTTDANSIFLESTKH